jgi:phosphatidylserine decarboxylase
MAGNNNVTRGRSCIIAREGWIFIFLFGAISALFFSFGFWILGVPLLFLTLFTVYFFRNPERVGPEGDGLVISPADGRVVEVSQLENNDYTSGPSKKIGIFMSVFNVHVNRAPISGEVQDIKYHPGKFLVASRDKASNDNERNAIILDIGKSSPIAVVQIAGLVARRIVCYLSKGLKICQGERLGLIRFGSRVDVYLPLESDVDVSIGDRVKAGVTIIGRVK